LEAIDDAMRRHELQIVLMRADRQMGRASERVADLGAVRHEYVGKGITER